MSFFGSIGAFLYGLPAQSLNLLSQAYKRGAAIHGIDTWKSEPVEVHVAKAIASLTAWVAGDRMSGKLVNACLRLVFAIYLSVEPTSDKPPEGK